jgi:uncharacterized protein (TIGR03083 family)
MTDATALAALHRETERTGTFLATLREEDWVRPTRCAPLNVLQLSAHVMRGGMRIEEMLTSGPVEGEAEKDGETYFRYDPAIGATMVQRAIEASEELAPSSAAAIWTRRWSSALDRAERDLATDDRLYRSIFGIIRLSEYLRTRVVEVTVHTMDMRDALGLAPDPSPEGLRVTCDVLRGLLGADTLALGIDDVHFALAGTGRAQLSDADRETLGPLADRFPLFA